MLRIMCTDVPCGSFINAMYKRSQLPTHDPYHTVGSSPLVLGHAPFLCPILCFLPISSPDSHSARTRTPHFTTTWPFPFLSHSLTLFFRSPLSSSPVSLWSSKSCLKECNELPRGCGSGRNPTAMSFLCVKPPKAWFGWCMTDTVTRTKWHHFWHVGCQVGDMGQSPLLPSKSACDPYVGYFESLTLTFIQPRSQLHGPQ